jgi:hypothetical protein
VLHYGVQIHKQNTFIDPRENESTCYALDDEFGVVSGMMGKGNHSTQRKLGPVPSQIPNDYTWAQMGATVVGSQWLTA